MKKISLLVSYLVVVAAGVLGAVSNVYASSGGEEAVLNIAPSIIVPTIKGDKEKFEQDSWLSRNVTGGVNEFTYLRRMSDTDKVELEGRALAGNNDYAFKSGFFRTGVGSIDFEFESYRKYFDGSGGFAAVPPTSSAVARVVDLDRDLYLTLGKFKLGGVLEKEDFPAINLSYEREHKDGAKSLTSWSTVESGSVDPLSYPLSLDIDEITDTIKMGISTDIEGIKVSLDQTIEHVEVETYKLNNFSMGTTAAPSVASEFRRKYEDLDFDRYDTVLRLSKQYTEKIFSSFGLMFSHYIGGTIEQITDTSTSSWNENHPPNPASIEYNVVTLLKNISYTPSKGVALNAAVKAEFSSKNGSSEYDRDRGISPWNTALLRNPDGIADTFRDIKSETDRKKIAESLGFKYSKIKNTVLFVETDFEQEKISQFEEQNSYGPGAGSDSDMFTRITDTNQYNNAYTFGLKWFPISKFNITPQYKYKQRMRDYDNKEITGDALTGYSAYIDSMDIYSHIPSLRLNYKPNRWLAYNVSYSLNTELYKVRTYAADATERAEYKSHVSSFDVTLSPRDDLFFNILYQQTKAVTSTSATKKSGSSLLPAYNSDYDVLSLACNYSLNDKTVLKGDYSFSKADNYDTNATFLPLGLDNLLQKLSLSAERKLNQDATMNLGYAFSKYEEDSNGGFDDYQAHLVSAGFKYIF